QSLKVVGNNGSAISLGNQLPSVQGFFSGSQGLSTTMTSTQPGLTYSITPGGMICSVPGDILGAACNNIIKPLLDSVVSTLQVVDGTLQANNTLVQLLVNTLNTIPGVNLQQPISVSASMDGVVSDPLQLVMSF